MLRAFHEYFRSPLNSLPHVVLKFNFCTGIFMEIYINPSFRRHPEEAALVGHILASFGEIELSVCANTATAHKLFNPVMSTLYSIRTTSTRIETALRLFRPAAELYDLIDLLPIISPMIWHCVRIRNQYAHCNWGDGPRANGGGLFFADLQASADNPNFSHDWKHIDPPLLQHQLKYFNDTMDWLNFANGEIRVKVENQQSNFWPRPPLSDQPALHNPPAEHVPPWLSEADKALHLAKAQAALGGPPTPTPKQLELERARVAKREARKLHAERSSEGSLPPPPERET